MWRHLSNLLGQFALRSKPFPLTRIARTGLRTRLGLLLRKETFPELVTSPKSFGTGFVLRFTRTCLNRAIQNHLYSKRQTANVISARWPSFPFQLHVIFIHKNCFGLFLSAYILLWEIVNLNLTFAVCHNHDSNIKITSHFHCVSKVGFRAGRSWVRFPGPDW